MSDIMQALYDLDELKELGRQSKARYQAIEELGLLDKRIEDLTEEEEKQAVIKALQAVSC